MRNLLLTIVLFFTCSFASAQKMSSKFLEGTWETKFHTVEFKTINKKELKITIILNATNELIDVISYKIHDGALYMETYYKANDWKSIGKMIIVDNNTLVEDIVSDAPGILIYKRKLTN
jgi:hypothetical protein